MALVEKTPSQGLADNISCGQNDKLPPDFTFDLNRLDIYAHANKVVLEENTLQWRQQPGLHSGYTGQRASMWSALSNMSKGDQVETLKNFCTERFSDFRRGAVPLYQKPKLIPSLHCQCEFVEILRRINSPKKKVLLNNIGDRIMEIFNLKSLNMDYYFVMEPQMIHSYLNDMDQLRDSPLVNPASAREIQTIMIENADGITYQQASVLVDSPDEAMLPEKELVKLFQEPEAGRKKIRDYQFKMWPKDLSPSFMLASACADDRRVSLRRFLHQGPYGMTKYESKESVSPEKDEISRFLNNIGPETSKKKSRVSSTVTSEEYLEESKSGNCAVSAEDLLRLYINRYFPGRSLQVFPIPSDSEKKFSVVAQCGLTATDIHSFTGNADSIEEARENASGGLHVKLLKLKPAISQDSGYSPLMDSVNPLIGSIKEEEPLVPLSKNKRKSPDSDQERNGPVFLSRRPSTSSLLNSSSSPSATSSVFSFRAPDFQLSDDDFIIANGGPGSDFDDDNLAFIETPQPASPPATLSPAAASPSTPPTLSTAAASPSRPLSGDPPVLSPATGSPRTGPASSTGYLISSVISSVMNAISPPDQSYIASSDSLASDPS